MGIKSIRRGWRSISTKVTVAVLASFLVGIWSLSFLIDRMLRSEMQSLITAQQFSTASLVAGEINRSMADRISDLQLVAELLGESARLDAGHAGEVLARRPVLQKMFTGGLFVTGTDGATLTAIPHPESVGNQASREQGNVAAALTRGEPAVGRPFLTKGKLAPTFGISVPIRDRQGVIIGSLTGLIDMALPGFLESVSGGFYGKSGGYTLFDPRHRLIITSTDQSRVMEVYSESGNAPLFDRFVQGYEGAGMMINLRGQELLVSAKRIPAAGWFVTAWLPTAEAFAAIDSVHRYTLAATGLLTLLTSLLTWWVVRRQLRPMVVTARELDKITDTGALPTVLSVTTQDEVGMLMRSFNRLLEIIGRRNQALNASERQFRVLIELTPDAVVVHRDGRVVYANPAAVQMVGAQTAGQLVGRAIMDRVHPDDRALSASRLRQMTEQAMPTPLIEYRFLKLDGTVITVQTHGVPVIFDGEPSLCTTMRDVTERNRADEIRRIGAIAFECQEGMVVMNQHWQVLQVNRAFSALTGLSRSDFNDLPFELPRGGPRVEGLAMRVRDGLNHDGGWIGEVWTTGWDHGQLLLRASFKAVWNESAQITHIIGTFIDLTKSHLLEQQRMADEKQLRQALVLEVHHRVKNNLQGINGLLNELAHAHPEVAAPVQHMIGQLQGVSVIFGLQGRASSIEIRLCELALAIAHEVQVLWRTPIAVDIPADWRACIVAEEEAVPMALVLNELMVNAVKHGGREHGWVKVSFSRSAEPSWIRIEIVNPRATFVLSEPPAYGHAGLDLVAALLPRQGARHFRENRGDQVVTVLELGPPVFEMSAQILLAPAPLIVD